MLDIGCEIVKYILSNQGSDASLTFTTTFCSIILSDSWLVDWLVSYCFAGCDGCCCRADWLNQLLMQYTVVAEERWADGLVTRSQLIWCIHHDVNRVANECYPGNIMYSNQITIKHTTQVENNAQLFLLSSLSVNFRKSVLAMSALSSTNISLSLIEYQPYPNPANLIFAHFIVSDLTLKSMYRVVSWPHFSWTTLYTCQLCCSRQTWLLELTIP